MAPAKRKRTTGIAVVVTVAKWKVGDLVLTKMKGFPVWPTMFPNLPLIDKLTSSPVIVVVIDFDNIDMLGGNMMQIMLVPSSVLTAKALFNTISEALQGNL
uniref:PWWP domain-containing protein n=1 Tax=Zea mays TaxID=4577 RepID=A0A804P2B6_MAIZE